MRAAPSNRRTQAFAFPHRAGGLPRRVAARRGGRPLMRDVIAPDFDVGARPRARPRAWTRTRFRPCRPAGRDGLCRRHGSGSSSWSSRRGQRAEASCLEASRHHCSTRCCTSRKKWGTCGSATDAEAQHRAGDIVPGPDRARSSTAWSASCTSARSRRLRQGARRLAWTRPQPHPWHGCAGGAVLLFSGRVPTNGCGGFG